MELNTIFCWGLGLGSGPWQVQPHRDRLGGMTGICHSSRIFLPSVVSCLLLGCEVYLINAMTLLCVRRHGLKGRGCPMQHSFALPSLFSGKKAWARAACSSVLRPGGVAWLWLRVRLRWRNGRTWAKSSEYFYSSSSLEREQQLRK